MNNFGELLSECWDSKSEEKLFEIKRTADPDNLLERCRALEGKVPDDKDSEETKIKKLTEGRYIPKVGDTVQIMDLEGNTTPVPKATVYDVSEDTEGNIAVEITGSDDEDERMWYSENEYQIILLTPAKESKVNEQDEPEDPEPSMPPEEEPKDEMPEPEPSAEEEAPEITKEYIGRSEDTHFYMVSTETDEGLVEDLELVDQEGVKKYSAKDNNLDPAEVDNFIIQVIQDIEINEIERSVFMKYILPKILEEEEPEPEEEELEDEEKPEKEEKPEPEEEEPVESKKVEEGLISVSDNAIFIGKASIGDGWQVLSTVEGSNMATALFTFDTEEEAAEAGQKIADAIGGKFFGTDDPRRKGPKTRSMESKKILSEMKVVDGENNEFDVLLSDDGTLDTVIDINGSEFRFDAEFASLFRDEEGTLSEEGLEELALDALANLEEDEYNELIGAAKEDAAEEYDVSRDDKGKFYVTRGEKTVNGPFDTEEEARDAIRELEGAKEDVGEAEEVKEQKEIPTGWDVNGNAITKGDKVFADDGRVQGKVEAIWDDGSVDIEYTSGPGGPLADTFDIKGHSVTKFSEDVEEKKKPPVCKKCGKKHWPFEKCSVKKSKEKPEKESVEVDEKNEETSEAKMDENRYEVKFIDRDGNKDKIMMEAGSPEEAEEKTMRIEKAKEVYSVEEVPVSNKQSYESKNTSEAKMGVDYVKTLKKAVKDATTALKDKDYDAAAKALEDAADDASDGARAAKKMKRADDAKAEEEAKKEKEEEKPKEESVEDESAEEVVEDNTDEKKKVPTCKKCGKAHWPFQKCGVAKKSKEKSEEGKVPDDKDPEQKKIDKLAEGVIDDIADRIKKEMGEADEVSIQFILDRIAEYNTEILDDVLTKLTDLGMVVEEGKIPDDKNPEQTKVDKLTEAEKLTKAQKRGIVVFKHESPKVLDDKDHYPINSEDQARNALARASQHKKAPKWYKGSLEALVKAVASAVHKKYPSIEITKAGKTPSKDGKKKEAIKVEQRKSSLDESKSMTHLKNLLGL